MRTPASQAGTPCWNSGPFKGLAKHNNNVSQCWQGGNSTYVGDTFLNNHNWVEFWDDSVDRWVHVNVGATLPSRWHCVQYEEAMGGCSWMWVGEGG